MFPFHARETQKAIKEINVMKRNKVLALFLWSVQAMCRIMLQNMY